LLAAIARWDARSRERGRPRPKRIEVCATAATKTTKTPRPPRHQKRIHCPLLPSAATTGATSAAASAFVTRSGRYCRGGAPKWLAKHLAQALRRPRGADRLELLAVLVVHVAPLATRRRLERFEHPLHTQTTNDLRRTKNPALHTTSPTQKQCRSTEEHMKVLRATSSSLPPRSCVPGRSPRGSPSKSP